MSPEDIINSGMSEQAAVASLIERGVQGSALAKLLAFAISLAVVPISSYFMLLNYIWQGNSTYAGITAVVMANLVLISYIIVSVLDDKGEPILVKGTQQPESKKTE